MKGFIINPDKEYVEKIMEGIYKKNGHCPCRVTQDETTLCPCDEFINDKICRCKLYVKKEEV
jgi:ferredoxin-thioredoxin reductase catalytic subunit